MQTWNFPDMHPDNTGPWSDEPDKAQWVDEDTDLDCLIVRNHSGALCGYVGVPPEHPLHGKDFKDVDLDEYPHGGLTFASACREQPDNHGICHIPLPGRSPDVWWFGFDCAHSTDLIPVYDGMFLGDRQYRDFAYVQGECARLAGQLAGVEK